MKEEYQDIMAMVNDLLELLNDVYTEDEDLDDCLYDTINQLEELKRELGKSQIHQKAPKSGAFSFSKKTFSFILEKSFCVFYGI